MEESYTTSQITKEYIKQNPAISYCLKKGLINYSKLSKLIAEDLKITKKSSIEAISIASIRYEKSIKNNTNDEIKIKKILKQSVLDIKTNISYILIKKNDSILAKIESLNSVDFIYVTQTNNHYLIIFEESREGEIKSKINSNFIDFENKGLVFLLLKTSKNIEKTPGVVNYLMGLLTEQQINIYEFVSCYDTTYFLVHKKDFPKTYQVLEKIME